MHCLRRTASAPRRNDAQAPSNARRLDNGFPLAGALHGGVYSLMCGSEPGLQRLPQHQTHGSKLALNLGRSFGWTSNGFARDVLTVA